MRRGRPRADVLRSATLVPVRFMGLDDRLGTVAAGRTASLVLVKGNPLEDIRNARLIEGVFQRGTYYNRAELDRLLSEAREAALSNPIVPAAPTATPVRPATLAPTATPVPTATSAPTPTALPPLVIDDTWATYTHKKYGFSFRYPSNWELKEITGPDNTMSGRAVHLLHPADPDVRMIIAFKHATEDARIAPTGIGGGELVSRGVVLLLGQAVERIVRVDLGKDMAVYYGCQRRRSDLLAGAGLCLFCR